MEKVHTFLQNCNGKKLFWDDRFLTGFIRAFSRWSPFGLALDLRERYEVRGYICVFDNIL